MGWEQWGEMEFFYKSRGFGVTGTGEHEEDAILFYEFNIEDSLQVYKTTEEFKNNASIDGLLHKDIWDDVYDTNEMSH